MVVRGRTQNDSMPMSRTNLWLLAYLVAPSGLLTTSGRCVLKTSPLYDSIDVEFRPGREAIGLGRANHVQPHHALFGIVQEERDHLERQNGRQPPRQVAEQRRQIAVRGDGFRRFQEQTQAVAIAQGFLAIAGIEGQNSHVVLVVRAGDRVNIR